MIVQSIDGNYYRNPIIAGRRFYIDFSDEGVVLYRQGKVLWDTARRDRGGVKCTLDKLLEDKTVTLNTRLVNCSAFKVFVKAPIPIPDHHRGLLMSKPEEQDFEGERLLTWR